MWLTAMMFVYRPRMQDYQLHACPYSWFTVIKKAQVYQQAPYRMSVSEIPARLPVRFKLSGNLVVNKLPLTSLSN